MSTTLRPASIYESTRNIVVKVQAFTSTERDAGDKNTPHSLAESSVSINCLMI